MKAVGWIALVVMVALAIARFATPISSYFFLLTDWVNRPQMVSQCMTKLDQGSNPQDQAVWQAMGISDPAKQPYLSRLGYCYKGSWDWQQAFRPRPG